MTYEYDAHGITSEGLKLYYSNKEKLGVIVRAIMDRENGESVLSLYDENEDCLRIVSGVTAGYNGEGPHGAIEILRDAGFDIKDNYVFKYESFCISK